MWRHPRPIVDGGVCPVSSGRRDHSIDTRDVSAAPERADVAPERAVPDGSGGHCGRPRDKGLRPGYAIPKRCQHREQTPQGFSESKSEDDETSLGWSAEDDWDEVFDEISRQMSTVSPRKRLWKMEILLSLTLLKR